MQLHARGEARRLRTSVVGRIATTTQLEDGPRADHVLLWRESDFGDPPRDYPAVLGISAANRIDVPGVFGVEPLAYLDNGDVVAVHPSGVVQVLYRRASPHNTLLVTERCNSLCLMCSQPPRTEDDSWRVPQILRALDLIDPACPELGFTGGEPTLLGDDCFAIVERAKQRLPRTALHILTNGRLFRQQFATRLGQIDHPDLMLGIPLYSDIDSEHDFVVQAQGAYDETIEGLYNLAEAGVRIELRIVVHGATYQRLPELAEFIARNLPFVSQVALMGLEMFGYVHLNMDTVWVDPAAYQDQLERATQTLALHGLAPWIFNHQLCVLRPSLWPFAVKSISDWKNVYLPMCDQCTVRDACGGFFHSGTKRRSAFIRALSVEELAQ
jgi:His-Xaa-Ser system radical SAM maturase HxsC